MMMMMSSSSINVLGDARTLRATLQELRKKMEEQVSIIITHQQAANTEEEGREGEKKKDTSDEEVIDEDDATTMTTESEQVKGLARLRRSTAVIVGEMNRKGLSLADTLVRCGIKKLILFDQEDASEKVDRENKRWELEENPSFELEAYVSSYELDDGSYEHFLDRLCRGGDEDRAVELVILPNVDHGSSPLYDFVSKAALEAGCPLLMSSNGEYLTVLEPSGNQLQIEDETTTLGMAALEFLLA